MALSADKLARELLKIGSDPNSMPSSPAEAGARWARAYAEYAKTAQAPTASPPAPLAPQQAVLAGALAAVFSSSTNPYQSASGVANALTTFWLAPPVVFGPGAVTAVGGTNVLAQALPGVWASNQAGGLPPDVATKKIAAVLDAFTRTVVVTSPGPVVGPIT